MEWPCSSSASSVASKTWKFGTRRNGFSFVISYEGHGGPGLQGRAGFVASWRPIYQNRCAIKVGGSPFKSFTEAEEACKAMLGYLTSKLE